MYTVFIIIHINCKTTNTIHLENNDILNLIDAYDYVKIIVNIPNIQHWYVLLLLCNVSCI